VYTVEEFVNLSKEELDLFSDITADEISSVHDILSEYVDIVEEEPDGEAETEFQCPECGHPISPDMTVCPNCHVGLSFEEVEIDEE
jgi:N utilization substance protein A